MNQSLSRVVYRVESQSEAACSQSYVGLAENCGMGLIARTRSQGITLRGQPLKRISCIYANIGSG